jgi:hypothetical protein
MKLSRIWKKGFMHMAAACVLDQPSSALLYMIKNRKINRGDNITTDVLVRICSALDCSIEDIMEIVPEVSK